MVPRSRITRPGCAWTSRRCPRGSRCTSPWRYGSSPREERRRRSLDRARRRAYLPSRLLLGGADRGRAAVHFDALAGVLQRRAVPLEDPVVLLDHVADQDRFAVRRERRALRPVADRRFAHARQRLARYANDDELAGVVVEGRVLRAVAAVVDDDRDDGAVRRDLQTLGRRAEDTDGVDDPRRLRGQVDQADAVVVASGAAREA